MRKIRAAIALLGAYKVSKPLQEQVAFFETYNMSDDENMKRIKKRYNSSGNQWAICTGASEGIGKSFALDLAKSGMNIYLVARNMEKLEAAKKDILSKAPPGVKVEIASADLSDPTKYSVITQNKEVTSNLGIIVNNAGHFQCVPVFEQKPQDLQSLYKLNIYAITLFTKYARNAFIQQSGEKDKRLERFGMVQVSSGFSDTPMPHSTVAGATKRYDDYFSRCFQQILSSTPSSRMFVPKTPDCIDTIIVKPGVTSTAAVNHMVVPLKTSLPEETTGSSLKCLGVLKSTNGSMLHNMLFGLYSAYAPHGLREFRRKQFGALTHEQVMKNYTTDDSESADQKWYTPVSDLFFKFDMSEAKQLELIKLDILKQRMEEKQ